MTTRDPEAGKTQAVRSRVKGGVMKLYKITLRNYDVAYSVANDAESAYQLVRKHLDKNDLGFKDERELLTVELIADDSRYPECKTRLYQKK